MSALSRDLAGLVFNNQKLGTHLNDKGETIDPVVITITELEKRNFVQAGTVLADIWSVTVIDTFTEGLRNLEGCTCRRKFFFFR